VSRYCTTSCVLATSSAGDHATTVIVLAFGARA
jgi:hypothetical protein